MQTAELSTPGSSPKRGWLLPTKDEQLALRETESLMRSNLMKLQVEEMLAEVKGRQRSKRLETAFTEIRSDLTSLPAIEVNSDWLVTQGMRSIELENRHTKPVSLHFLAPQTVERIGSYDLGLGTAPFLNMDLCVLVPEQCLDGRDILNHVYFDKRKLYLAVLLARLLKHNPLRDSEVLLSFLKGDTRKPIIVLRDQKRNQSIRILLAVMHRMINLDGLTSVGSLTSLQAIAAPEQ